MNSGEDSAFPMISLSSSASHVTKAPYLCRRIHPGRSLQKSLRSGSRQGAWAHNLWEECILTGGRTPQLAETQGMFALALST